MTDTAVAQEPKAAEEAPKESAPVEPVEPSLDQLLNEYEEGTEAKPEQKDAEKTDDPKMSEVLDFVRQTQADKVKSDISDAVKTAKDGNEALAGVGDNVVRRYLEFEASEDKRVQNAWVNRSSNPEGWDQVLKALGNKLAGEIKIEQPDPQLSADREAARASVRGSSTQAPPEEKRDNDYYNNMSDAEFNQELRKHGYPR